jgi:hypothetical protein
MMRASRWARLRNGQYSYSNVTVSVIYPSIAGHRLIGYQPVGGGGITRNGCAQAFPPRR